MKPPAPALAWPSPGCWGRLRDACLSISAILTFKINKHLENKKALTGGNVWDRPLDRSVSSTPRDNRSILDLSVY